ncbi:hypothetical protein [Verrucomicrobium sp. BvORR034]|uniref:hypothetical protein n=1 Tax=Verrucomicrobium sp. BvORR034 TaxID=1396418 RepID=UPI0006793398|nr:hypothetical protein [Verrucomicrobium sp. BvORR034]
MKLSTSIVVAAILLSVTGFWIGLRYPQPTKVETSPPPSNMANYVRQETVSILEDLRRRREVAHTARELSTLSEDIQARRKALASTRAKVREGGDSEHVTALDERDKLLLNLWEEVLESIFKLGK